MLLQNRWLAGMATCAALVVGGVALGQPVRSPEPSPLAPGDLKRPIFDTRTPVYDATGEQAKSAKTVVAEVDGRAITLGDVADAIAELPAQTRNLPFADLFPTVLEQLVRQQALVIRAQRRAVDEDPAVRRKMRAVSDRLLGDELLKNEASAGITEEALLARYNKEFAGKPGPEEVHVRVIMVASEEEAKGIIGELRGGADFAALAKRSSKDPLAASGGDAGFLTLNQLTPEVGSVVFSMEPGHFTSFPVKSGGSWFVFKMDERRRGATRPFSVEREGLRQTMIREGVTDVVQAAVADVSIRVFDINGKEFSGSSEGGGARRAE